jgi:hypothetical protein
VIYNARLAEDKKRDGGKKPSAAKQKPVIKMGKGIDSGKNNNTAMIGELVGSDEDEYGDYGNEYGAEGSKREAEGDYDFM